MLSALFPSCFPPPPAPTIPPSSFEVEIGEVKWKPDTHFDRSATDLLALNHNPKEAQKRILSNIEKIECILDLKISARYISSDHTSSITSEIYHRSKVKTHPLLAILIIQEAELGPSATIVNRAFEKYHNPNLLNDLQKELNPTVKANEESNSKKPLSIKVRRITSTPSPTTETRSRSNSWDWDDCSDDSK